MAILTEDGNEYEVRIRRTGDGTYFDEYIKLGDREKLDALEVDRYIVGEPGTTYGIEISVKKGFHFAPHKEVSAVMHLSGQQSLNDWYSWIATEQIQNPTSSKLYTDADIQFNILSVYERLIDETNVIGVNPQHFGSFRISVCRRTVENEERTHSVSRDNIRINSGRDLTNIQAVDPMNYKKHGITYTMGFDETRIPTAETKYVTVRPGTILSFHFHCRTAEFLEHTNIVRYPPPPFCYPWDKLRELERKMALTELQEINKMEVRSQSVNPLYIEMEQRKEWRSWNKMDPCERKHAFEKLQKAHKAFERGEVLNQIVEVPTHKIIVLDDDGQPRREAVSTGGASLNVPIPRSRNNARNNTREIKQEVIDVERNSSNRIYLKRGRGESPALRTIKQELTDLDTLGASRVAIPPAETIKHDLTELDSPFGKKVKLEEHAGAITAPVKLEDEIVFKMENDAMCEASVKVEGSSEDGTSRIKIEDDDEGGPAVQVKSEEDDEDSPSYIKLGEDMGMVGKASENVEAAAVSEDFMMTDEDWLEYGIVVRRDEDQN